MSPEQILTKLGITKVITVSCDDSVEKALKIIQKKQLRAAPVVDKDGLFMGMFSAHDVIKSLVPSYMADGVVSLDFATGASPVLAMRLKELFPTRVGDHVTSENSVKITTKTHTWEALRMLTKYGSPLPVVDVNSGHLKGLISEQSAIDALLQIEADESENDNN